MSARSRSRTARAPWSTSNMSTAPSVLPSDEEVKKLRPAEAMKLQPLRPRLRSLSARGEGCERVAACRSPDASLALRAPSALAHGSGELAVSSCMTFDAFLFQALNGLASASGLFLVGAGLSLIFGVTRIINIAHGSLYMLGIYIAYTLRHQGRRRARLLGRHCRGRADRRRDRRADRDRAAAAHLPGARTVPAARHLRAGAGHQRRRALDLWGPEDLLGPRAPGLRGAVEILGRGFPSYDLFLIVVGPDRAARAASHAAPRPASAGWSAPRRRIARWSARSASTRRCCSPPCSRCGAFLAGLGGALQVAREPANLAMDLTVIGDAFVVVVVGGMGSITGAYLAAVIIAEVKALCIGIGVVEFRRLHRQFLQAHAGRRIPGDGGGADRAALRPARPAAGRGAQSVAEPRTRSARPPRRSSSLGVAVAASLLALLPLLDAHVALRAGARHRRADRGAVRHQPALHHGAGRHAFVRPCRLFRPRRLWRGAAGQVRSRCRCRLRSLLAPLRRRAPARCCSAGSRCGCPASISRC